MPARRKPLAARPKISRTQDEVFVDFVFDHGLLFVALVNASPRAVYEVSVAFEPAFHGLGGTVDVSALPLFRCVEFLAPHKRLETLLDESGAYFGRQEPRRIEATVSWRNARGRRYRRRIVHDLTIYEDVSYIVRRATPGRAAVPGDTITGRGNHGSAQG